jgi:hypothetical protein
LRTLILRRLRLGLWRRRYEAMGWANRVSMEREPLY